MKVNAAEQYLHGLLSLSEHPVPERVMERARYCLLDFIGESLAGGKLLSDRMSGYLDMVLGNSNMPCTVLGHGKKFSMYDAAFVNGFQAHATELDDGHRYGMIHIGASVIPSVIASAEKEGRSMEDVLRGIVFGYEAAVRLSSAIQPGHKKKGYHTSGTCGTVGSAMGVAFLNNFCPDRLRCMLAMAVSGAAGILGIQEDGSELKPYNVARASMDGLVAAYVSGAHFLPPADIMGGRQGLFEVMCADVDLSGFSELSGDRFGIEEVYMKPYAACRHCHAPIDGILNLVRTYGIDPDRIDTVLVETYALAVKGHDHTFIVNPSSAKLSIPFSVALAALTGRAGLIEYETMFNDSRALNLTKKVHVCENDELTSWSPAKRASRLSVKLDSGEQYSVLIEYALGEPENPMSRESIVSKFKGLAGYSGMGAVEIDEIINKILI